MLVSDAYFISRMTRKKKRKLTVRAFGDLRGQYTGRVALEDDGRVGVDVVVLSGLVLSTLCSRQYPAPWDLLLGQYILLRPRFSRNFSAVAMRR